MPRVTPDVESSQIVTDGQDAPESAIRAAQLSTVWFDRDLGWLEFNRRVLNEAQDERTPLLERVKFLAIVGSNLDEFFMKRIGVLRGKADADDDDDPEARTANHAAHLAEVRRRVSAMLDAQAQCYTASILP